ncbi:MAG: hypothetical protein ACTHJ3_07575, partial [Pararhizobium sp.]
AMALVDAKLAYHREAERQKKAAKRAARSVQNMEGHESDLSLHKMEGQNGGCPSRICSSVPPEFRGNTPLGNPSKKEDGREEDFLGSNVVRLDHNRRNAS